MDLTEKHPPLSAFRQAERSILPALSSIEQDWQNKVNFGSKCFGPTTNECFGIFTLVVEVGFGFANGHATAVHFTDDLTLF